MVQRTERQPVVQLIGTVEGPPAHVRGLEAHRCAAQLPVVRWFDQETLATLLPRLRDHRYFTLPVPVADYDSLPEAAADVAE